MSQEPVEPAEKSEEELQTILKSVSSTPPNQFTNMIDIISRLKDCTFILAGIVLLFYVTGFIIVSCFLLYEGVPELEIAKARYVSVGVTFWAVILIGICSASIFYPYLAKSFQEYDKQSSEDTNYDKTFETWRGLIRKGLITTLVAMIIGSFIAIVLLFKITEYLSDLHFILVKAKLNYIIFWIFLHCLIVSIGMLRCLLHWMYREEFKQHSMSYRKYLWNRLSTSLANRILYLFLPIIYISGVLGSVTLYATSIYPLVNPALGGGCFPNIQFVTNKNDVQMLNNLVAIDAMDEHAGVSKPVQLLEKTSSSYIVLVNPNSNDEHAVVISKELVKGFRTLPSTK